MFGEKIYQRDFIVSSLMLSPKGGLKLHQLLEVAQDASIGGSAFVGASVESLREKNLYWVVMSYGFVIERKPELGESLSVLTYPGDNQAFIYPRHYKIVDRSGRVIIRGIGLWALLDGSSHKPSGPESNHILLKTHREEGELSWPPRLMLANPVLVESREVRPSDLDFNGHMNNIRYLDFALDTEKEIFEDAHDITDCQINFHSETHLGSAMELYREEDGKRFAYEGRVDGKKVFALAINVRG